MSPKGTERREHRRVNRTLHFKSADNDKFVEMQCKNISLGGAYCISEVAYPLMTKLMLHLYLPSTDGRLAIPTSPLMLNAYVVRSEKISERSGKSRYHLAIFFKELEAAQAKILKSYLRKANGSKVRQEAHLSPS